MSQLSNESRLFCLRITLTLNHLKNNSKKFVELFGQLEKKLYFCTRFREGSRFIKIDKKFFSKKFW